MKLNKKAGEEINVLIWVALAIVAAFAIGYFVYNSFGKLNDAMSATDAENKAIVVSCQFGLKSSKTDDAKLAQYCGNFISPAIIGGKKNYVNCAYVEKRGLVVFTFDEIEDSIKLKCNETVMKKQAYNKCAEFNQSHSGDTVSWVEYINGVKCTKTFTNVTFSINESMPSDVYYEINYPTSVSGTTP